MRAIKRSARACDGADEATLLSVTDLKVEYSRLGLPGMSTTKVAAEDISFTLGKSEIIGLVGESGSGKTTTGMAVAGLVKASGSIVLMGRDMSGRRGVRRRLAGADIQVIFQDPHAALDPRQRIGRGLRELRRQHPERASWITDEQLLDRVGLRPELADRLPHQLSGGQAQRVCVARAILLRPRLVIADEPTSALDVSVQAQILALLRDLAADQHIGILFISHDLAVVRGICHRVMVMRNARIVEAGPTEQILTDPSHEYTRRLLAAVPGGRVHERDRKAVDA
jgi:ABC-type glutathione transport system ATPase component